MLNEVEELKKNRPRNDAVQHVSNQTVVCSSLALFGHRNNVLITA